MPRQQQATVQQEEEVRRLVYQGYGAAQIFRELERKGLFKEHQLSKRTIERMVRRFAPLDPSGPWSLRDADPEDAHLVLDVVVHTFEETDGRVWLTNDLADRVVRLRKATPSIPSQYAYPLARLYQAAGDHDDLRAFDLAVGLRIWESAQRHVRWGRILDIEGMQESITKIFAIISDPFAHAEGPSGSAPDSNLTAKPADDSGQAETNRLEQ